MNIMLKDYENEHFTRMDWLKALVACLALFGVMMAGRIVGNLIKIILWR